jgi:ribose transport system substrate-binding protein
MHSRYLALLIAPLLFIAQNLIAQNRESLGEYRIGILGQTQADSIYQATHRGAKQAAADLSEKYSIDVELLFHTPDLSRGGSQSDSLAELFIEDADGLIISPNQGELVRSAVEFAIRQEQEVIFFEREIEGVEALFSIVADEASAGSLAAEAIREKLSSGGRVAILTSTQPNDQLEARLDGIRKSLGYRRIAMIVETDPDYRSSIKALEAAVEADRGDEIDGWIFLDNWPLLGMPALPWEAGRAPAVAIESSPSAFVYMDQGYLDALVVHPYYEWGYAGVERMVEKLHHGQEPDPAQVITKPLLIDWRNLEDYRRNWQDWFR